MDFIKHLITFLFRGRLEPPEAQIQPVAPLIPPSPPIMPPEPAKQPTATAPVIYLWDTPENARHSLRVICDEEGMTPQQKNLMSQVVHCESGYSIKATHPNLNAYGNVASTDYGICQWNDWWHWIKSQEISPEDALNNPEKAVRLMCKYVKEGLISQWVCYSSGLYMKYPA